MSRRPAVSCRVRRAAGGAGALAGALLVALGCSEEPEAPEVVAPPVMVERATARTLVERIEATGQLLAQAEATVAAQVGGEITAVVVEEGSAAGAGETIIEIDPERRELELADTRASLVQAEAQLEEARREARRLESLAEHGAVSQSRLDEARTRVQMARSARSAARARLGLAERAVRDANVAAPFDGLVARRHVSVGEFVAAGAPLFELVALDPVEVEFHLAEVDSSRVAVGQQVDVRVASHPGETFHAEVSVVAPTIAETTRTRRVKALLPNPEGRLLPGTFARVDLGVAEREGVVMIPQESVLQRSDGSVVFRLVGSDRVERLRVETGHLEKGLLEVRGPVASGDWVVVRGHTGLIDGSAVSLRNADGQPVELGDFAELRP